MLNNKPDAPAEARPSVGVSLAVYMARWRSFLCLGLQDPASFWPLGLGIGLGLGLGIGALLGVGGIFGMGVCLLVLGTVCWFAKDAEPVLGRPVPSRTPGVTSATVESALEMVIVQGGTFLMGSPNTDAQAYADEKPRHEVTVSDFFISRYPITRQLYREILGQSPASWGKETDDDRLPANYMSWFDAIDFCNSLSAHVGLQPCYRRTGTHVEWDSSADGYRLPTEAEWEYACRASTTSAWFFGDDPVALEHYAWFVDNSAYRVHPVGEKAANPWGLYDMIGNVWEWCWDWYDRYRDESVHGPTGPQNGTQHVLRGGATWRDPRGLRSAVRDRDVPVNRFGDVGFRCVRGPCRQL